MLEFPEQVLKLSMPVGRGTKGPTRPPMGSTWTDNDYLNLRALFDIISSSGRSPEELFLRSWSSPASVWPTNCPSVNISCYRISSKTTGRIFFKKLVRMFPSVPSCAGTKMNSGPLTNMAVVGHLWFFLLSHLLRNYLTDSNETCLLCSPRCLVVQVQKKFRSVDKFGRLVPGLDLVKFPNDSLVIASPPRSLVGFF